MIVHIRELARDAYLQKLLGSDMFIALAALKDGAVVRGLAGSRARAAL